MPLDMQTMGHQIFQMMSSMMGMETGRQHHRMPKIQFLNGAPSFPTMPPAAAPRAIMGSSSEVHPPATSPTTPPPTEHKLLNDVMQGQPAAKRSIAEVVAEIGATIDQSKTDKAMAKGKAKGKAKAKAKKHARSKKPKAKMTKEPVSKETKCKATAKDTTSGLLLGCPKCRGSRTGCGQCRLPSYVGKRFQKR
jgi:hypothetical protein